MQQCFHYGYSLIYSQYICENHQVHLPENILQKDVDGLIFFKEIDQQLMAKLASLELPFVIIDDHMNHDGVCGIRADYRLAAHTAVQYLLERGHREIGFIGNTQLPAFFVQVITGYQDALRDHHITINPAWIFDHFSEQNALEQLGNTSLPSALFCMEDMLAVHVIRALQQLGINVPQDISIISIDNILLAEYLTPSLTTVAIDMEQMGVCAVDALMKKIRNESATSVEINSNSIIERDSVCSLN